MKKDCKKQCCGKGTFAWILVIVGGINWGLTGIGILASNPKWNLVHLIFGKVGANVAWLEAIIYLLVGFATIGLIFKHKHGKKCKEGVCMTKEEMEACCADGTCAAHGEETMEMDEMSDEA